MVSNHYSIKKTETIKKPAWDFKPVKYFKFK